MGAYSSSKNDVVPPLVGLSLFVNAGLSGRTCPSFAHVACQCLRMVEKLIELST